MRADLGPDPSCHQRCGVWCPRLLIGCTTSTSVQPTGPDCSRVQMQMLLCCWLAFGDSCERARGGGFLRDVGTNKHASMRRTGTQAGSPTQTLEWASCSCTLRAAMRAPTPISRPGSRSSAHLLARKVRA